MKKYIVIFLITFLLIPFINEAKPTKIIIRAKAKDAKFVGSSIGGALVIVRSSLTNEILAKGITEGETGNTKLLMKGPHKRGQLLTDDKTAKFEATINIDEPTFVTVDVYSPVNKKQATIHASTQLWLIPGKDILRDGIIVQIPGFIVDILAPQTHELISRKSVKNSIQIKANVAMMCGCPIIKDGIWDANKYDVEAIVKKDGQIYKTIKMSIKDKPDIFYGNFQVSENGLYEVTVYSYDPLTGNTGVDKTNFIVRD